MQGTVASREEILEETGRFPLLEVRTQVIPPGVLTNTAGLLTGVKLEGPGALWWEGGWAELSGLEVDCGGCRDLRRPP